MLVGKQVLSVNYGAMLIRIVLILLYKEFKEVYFWSWVGSRSSSSGHHYYYYFERKGHKSTYVVCIYRILNFGILG